jgi:myo-inositol-hexaphosphate 3-phosphohydrolase
MKIVMVKHTDDGKEFAFYVPSELAPFIRKGQGVLCSTRHGLAYGTTTTGIIRGDGAKDVAVAHGAYFPMRPIVAFEHEELANADTIRKAVTREFMQQIATHFGQDAC